MKKVFVCMILLCGMHALHGSESESSSSSSFYPGEKRQKSTAELLKKLLRAVEKKDAERAGKLSFKLRFRKDTATAVYCALCKATATGHKDVETAIIENSFVSRKANAVEERIMLSIEQGNIVLASALLALRWGKVADCVVKRHRGEEPRIMLQELLKEFCFEDLNSCLQVQQRRIAELEQELAELQHGSFGDTPDISTPDVSGSNS